MNSPETLVALDAALSGTYPSEAEVEPNPAAPVRAFSKAALGLIAGVALLSVLGEEYSNPAEAAARDKGAVSDTRASAKQLPVVRPAKITKCTSGNQVVFSLRGKRNVTAGKKQVYQLTAKACPGTSREQLRRIKVVRQTQTGKARSLTIKNLKPGKRQKRKLSLVFPKSTKAPKLSVRAYGSTGKKIGANNWNLSPKKAKSSVYQSEQETSCMPRPDFRVGIQDDSAFVWQKYGSREAAFDLAEKTYQPSILRMNLLYDDVKAHGYQPYVDTIKEAKKRDYEVFITLLPTPSYRDGGDQTLNYVNLDPAEMQKFAQESITTLGPAVTHVEIGNEPNHPLFSESRDLDKYLIMLRAGRDGARAANPNIKVIGGGLAPSAESSLVKWLQAVSSVKHVQASMHPYGHLIDNLSMFKAPAGSAIGKPLNLTEYTNFASNPNQMQDNIKAILMARCAGAAMIIMYQLYDDPKVEWRGGVHPIPPGH